MIQHALIRPLRWFRRFRKRRGYGIHSPFAFHFVTGVIYEKGEFYAYAPLHEKRRQLKIASREKDDRLLFRIANFHQPQTLLAVGKGEAFDMACEYMTTAHQCTIIKSHNTATVAATEADLIYLHADLDTMQVEQLLNSAHDRLLVIVKQPHATTHTQQAWHQLCRSQKVRQSYDLHDFGLCIFHERLNKEDFIINYY